MTTTNRLLAGAILAFLVPATAFGRPLQRPTTLHRSGAAQKPPVAPPVQVGDTFVYNYTANLAERIDGKPFRRFFKGQSTTNVESFNGKVSGNPIQFDFFAEGGDIDNSDILSTLVNFTGSGSTLSETVWGYTQSADPTGQFGTAFPGFSTPYIVDTYPESGGASWTSNGANLNEYTVQSFVNSVYYQDGFIDTKPSGQTLQDDILFNASAGTATGTNTTDNADGSGRLSVVPADHAGRITTFGLPVKAGSGYVIPVTSGGQTVNVPDWFPGGAQPPQPITNDSFAISASATTPKDCGPTSGMSANDLHETVLVVSVTHGTVSQRDTHYYDTPIGTICRLETITIDQYDNTSDGKLDGTIGVTIKEYLASSSLQRRNRRAPNGSTSPFRSDFSFQEFLPEVSFQTKFLF